MSPEARPFQNSSLFSSHFLENLVQKSMDWRDEEGLAKAFYAIKDLYGQKARALENYNESQLEENFIRPEGYLVAKAEDLTPKIKIQSYYEHDFDAFLAVIKKNKKKLKVDPARREPAEALRAEFDGSIGTLGPLRERIRLTDELIDDVVYKLYGLTEEEIRIVEGSSK